MRWQNQPIQGGNNLIDVPAFLVDMVLLNDRNPSAPWKHLVFRRISFEGMQDHRYLCLQSAYQTWSNTFWLSFLLQPSLLPISVATNWLDLLRFANREQFQTHLSATHPHGILQLKSNIKHIHSIWVHPRLHLMACWHILYSTWTTVEVGVSADHRA